VNGRRRRRDHSRQKGGCKDGGGDACTGPKIHDALLLPGAFRKTGSAGTDPIDSDRLSTPKSTIICVAAPDSARFSSVQFQVQDGDGDTSTAGGDGSVVGNGDASGELAGLWIWVSSVGAPGAHATSARPTVMMRMTRFMV
jgi:hypothetical protein